MWRVLVATVRGSDGAGLTGVRALYRGFLPTIAGIVPYAGISFFTYDTLKTVRTRAHRDVPVSSVERLVMGAIAGAVAQTVAYPLDLVRRRMQVHGLAGAPTGAVYTSVLAAVRYGNVSARVRINASSPL